jgi:sialate O-acetylesterase
MKFKPAPLLAFAAALALTAAPAIAGLRLPSIISDHMMLNADHPAAFWGWADPSAKVTVAFRGAAGKNTEATAKADESGRWSLDLPALPPDMPGAVEIKTDKGETKDIADVITGHVWLAGGQSNMTYHVDTGNVPRPVVEQAKRDADALRGAVRYFLVTKYGADSPQDDVPGEWFDASADTVGRCSAVAWYFAVKLHENLQQPTAVICSSVGGTPVEAWIPKWAFDNMAVAGAIWKRHKEALATYSPQAEEKFKTDYAAWQAANPGALQIQNAQTRPREPYGPESKSIPIRLYNGMIHGLEPYTLDGIIWYQADGNAGFPGEYPELIKTLIQSWRKEWAAELPFYYVEMNNMWEPQDKPVENDRNLGPIREEQQAALELPKTGVVTAIDLGDATSITNPHFPNKQPVGDRLANLVSENVYGKDLGEVHSPEFKNYAVDGNTIRIHLKYAGGLRVRGGGPLKGFAIRGSAEDWVWADAKINGQDIIVSSPQVSQPKAVRYAWAANPVISVENGAGLPLRPFRTDTDAPW